MIADAVAAVVDALEGEGQRVAIRAGDLTPPCFYVLIGSTTDAGGPLEGGVITVLWAHYVPIRGVDNATKDAAALDAAYRALRPLAMTELTGTRTSVTVANDTWPCYRLDVAVLAVAAALRNGAD